ncbi:hypothetical protein KVR01_002527 [Diaporthe batatas]|uniref:uncharacterized protein n=1 Tax=Diaporthe batatas TaxID=748121 RepID=UPI001D04E438|nr:uncharacterized protein KVR01_002527 [Diaporthe batatas]KAG8166838.1 hypothetical protein KVR01_002527 [Diaporthe batatas]
MLRRHNINSKSDLHRRKSIASVRGVHLEHIDSVVAQRDAQTAAMEAFSRALTRQSAERALFPPQPTGSNKENTSPAGLSRCGSTASLRNAHGRTGLERRQSVRFIGPETRLQTRPSHASMRAAAPGPPEIPARRPIHRSQSTQSISYVQRPVLRDAGNMPLPDRTSSVGKTLMTPEAVKLGLSQACLQALTPDYEKYTPEDDIASMPSSYRRIRKTRSTHTMRATMRGSVDGRSGKTQGVSPQNTKSTAQHKQIVSGTLFPRPQFLRRRDNISIPATPNLRAAKSMSFLKPRRSRSEKRSSINKPIGGSSSPPFDAQDPSSSHMISKPSRVFGSRCGENQQSLPKTLRGSSADTELPSGGASASLGRSRSGSLRNRARKVSTSLKTRLKNLFINKSEEGAGLPAQQIEAQRTHVSEVCDENPWVATLPEQEHYRERSSLSKVSTRIPFLHAVPSHERLHSRRGSIDSGRSTTGQDPDEKSRVTSWASTDTDTVIARRTEEGTEEWEKQRLWMINEHGMRNFSPPSGCPMIGLQTITSQEELAAPPALQGLPPGATVDSQRVYSALIKKMNETKQLAGIVEQQRKSSDGSDPFRTLSPSSSDRSSDNGDTVASTEAYVPRRIVPTSGREAEDHPRCEGADSEGSASTNHRITQRISDDRWSLSPPIHLTPQGQRSEVASTIIDRGSAFFGSPTSHLFRTTSPYRRSLQQAMRAEREQGRCQDTAEGDVETTALGKKLDATAKVAYSESNYSSDTLIHKTNVSQGGHGSQHPNMSDSREEATVLQSTPTYRPTGERQVSTASSLGWKTWLSADIAKLESSPTRVSGQSPEVEYRIPTMPRSLGHGHVREAAQTDTNEEDEQNSKPIVRIPTSSTTPLSAIDSNVVKLSPQQRSVMRASTPPAADLRKSQFHLAVGHSIPASSSRDGEVSNVFGEAASRPPESPAEETRPSWNKPAAEPRTPLRGQAVRQSQSLAGLKSNSRIGEPQTGSPQPPASSTIRLMRKPESKLAPDAMSAASTPGFTGVFERQFGSLGHHQLDGQLMEKENQVPHHDDGHKHSPHTKGHFRGSKAMVDLFLSSRRRQGISDGDGAAFI